MIPSGTGNSATSSRITVVQCYQRYFKIVHVDLIALMDALIAQIQFASVR